MLVLVPWPFAFLAAGDRLGALGVVARPITSFGDLLRFFTASNGAGIAGWAFVLAGLLVAAVATGERAVWSARLWGLAVISWWLAALPAWLGTSAPEVEGMLVPAALAMALLAGVGVVTFQDEIRTRGLGWQQVAAIGAGALLVLGGLGFVGDTTGGRFHQPNGDWIDALDWMHAQRDGGPFRVLWLGDPSAVPGSGHRSGPDVYSLTVDGPGDLRDLLPPPGGTNPTGTIDAAVDALQHRRTSRFGAAVAAEAIRYVVVPLQAAPDSASRRMPVRLAAAFADQLDLRELQSVPGIRVFENTAWVPGDALAGERTGFARRRRRAAPADRDRTRADAVVVAAVFVGVGGVGRRPRAEPSIRVRVGERLPGLRALPDRRVVRAAVVALGRARRSSSRSSAGSHVACSGGGAGGHR